MRLPHRTKPCPQCPFKKTTTKGWLGKKRITELTEVDSFGCHKNTDLQCAGQMLLLEDRNSFVNLAHRMNINLNLQGRKDVFDAVQDCIDHHTN